MRCPDGSDGDGGEDGGMEADSDTASEVEGGVDGAGKTAAPAAAVLVGPDKKKKKKREPRSGKQQRLNPNQRQAFLILRARYGDDKRRESAARWLSRLDVQNGKFFGRTDGNGGIVRLRRLRPTRG